MTPANLSALFGDTTYTKVFVGGLAWETQKDTMKKYFEQFGDILEAVIITDKLTGRSKGYGFVTFREPEAAKRACVDAAPVIDGRRANCNLASLGVQRSKPSTPKQVHAGGGTGRNYSGMRCFQTGFGGAAAATAFSFPLDHYAFQFQHGIPFNNNNNNNVYGYSQYSPDYSNYPTSYYSVYGGATAQYPIYGGGPAGLMTGAGTTFYPYLQLGEGTGGAPCYSSSQAQGYGVHYPHLFHYSTGSTYPHQYGVVAPMSPAPTPPLQSGVTMALHAPAIPHH